jgi:hypothetical protein
MLRPFLLVGVGGSGGKTLRALKQTLELELMQLGWTGGWPKAWQLLHVDSPTNQDGASFPAPFLPTENYQGLVTTGTAYKQAYGAVALPGKIPSELLPDVEKPLPSAEEVKIPIGLGAGQYRAIGRTIVLAKLSEVRQAAAAAIGRMNSAEARGQLDSIGALLRTKEGSGVTDPIVIVVSSIAGGSGAGQYLDVTEAVKSAAPSSTWVHQIFSILYAPDVFSKIDGKGGVEPNALAAMSEAMAGLWMETPSASTEALYKSQGLVSPSHAIEYSMGPAFTYVVGRQNSNVDFDDQPAVYQAVAASLSTWVTDDKVQDDMLAYAIANRDQEAVDAVQLPDLSRLKVENRQAPPFSSLGFGRVSLGKDRFMKYASERLARSAIDRMLYLHKAEDPEFKVKTQDEWIAFKADASILDFIKELKLNEATEQNNDVIDALRPIESRDVLYATFLNQVLLDSQQGLDKSGGQSLSSWHEKLMNFYQVYVERALDEETNARNAKARNWTIDQSNHAVTVVARYVSQQGLKVTNELLLRLETKLYVVADELISESNTYKRYAAEVRSYVGQELQRAQGQETLRPDHPAVLAAAEQCKNALGWRAESDLRELTAELLRDLAKNFIGSLRIAISGGEKALLTRATEQQDLDGRVNAYLGWPTFESTNVPKRFNPAPNERLMIDVEQFPSEFAEQLRRSVGEERQGNAFSVVIDEVLMGSLELVELEPENTWSLFEVKQEWIPQYKSARKDSSQAAQSANFDFSSDPNTYLVRARMWMQRKGTSFYGYLNEDMASYLSESRKDRGETSERIRKFREQFDAAVASSEPLIKLNAGLLMTVHGKSLGERRSVVSAIPFPMNSDLYKAIKEILLKYNMWTDKTSDEWFRDSNVQNIDIFSLQKFPYQPMVMDSLVQPIAQQWLASRNEQEKREAFLKWRRARTLRESIPAAPAVIDAMLRGWFVAKILGHLDAKTDDIMRGPKISVWAGPGNRSVNFPHPLMHKGFAAPYDYPGALMESLSIAIVLCNAEGSLEPLAAYHRLMDLGFREDEVCQELTKWIQSGQVSDSSAQQPNPERAGEASSSIDQRKERILDYLHRQEQEFIDDVVKLTPGADIRAHPITWEIRDEVLGAIRSLKTSISAMRAERSGV